MAVTKESGLLAVRHGEPLGSFGHPWFAGTLLAGAATGSQLRAFGTALVGLYDQLPRLYGPPVMTGADYKVRRLVADQLLSTLDLPDGGSVRVGEGGHAALAAVLAASLGAQEGDLGAAALRPRLVAAADELVTTMFEPPAWVSMAAVAQTEADHAADLGTLRDALRDAYHVEAPALALLDAPPLYPSWLADDVASRLGTPFDDMLYAYYRVRIHNEWQACWDHCFDAAASA